MLSNKLMPSPSVQGFRPILGYELRRHAVATDKFHLDVVIWNWK
jgi:hypothetical protein